MKTLFRLTAFMCAISAFGVVSAEDVSSKEDQEVTAVADEEVAAPLEVAQNDTPAAPVEEKTVLADASDASEDSDLDFEEPDQEEMETFYAMADALSSELDALNAQDEKIAAGESKSSDAAPHTA